LPTASASSVTSAGPGGGASRRAGRRCSPWPICVTATPYSRLAAGFEIGVATAWRYVQEAITLLAAAAEDLATAMQRPVD
jgi:hypothetical protein